MQIIDLSKKFVEKSDTVSMKPEVESSVKQSELLKEVEKVSGEEAPAKPKKSAREGEYPRMEEIYVKLQQQNMCSTGS